MTRRERRLWRDLPRPERVELLRLFRAALARCRSARRDPDPLTWEWAVLLAEFWWTTREVSGSAVREGLKRWRGKGRRPTTQAIDRRLKRQGLGVSTLDGMLRRLDELGKTGNDPLGALLQLKLKDGRHG